MKVLANESFPPPAGVVLFRFAAPSPEQVAARAVAVLLSRSDWAGQFAVVEETRVRLRPLPTRTR